MKVKENETRVTGLLHDRESAKQVIEELKGAGFTDKSILIAMHDESAQEGFLRETKGQAISEEEIPSLPELTSGQILVMVEAEQRVDDAVNILNRHHAITAGSSYADDMTRSVSLDGYGKLILSTQVLRFACDILGSW